MSARYYNYYQNCAVRWLYYGFNFEPVRKPYHAPAEEAAGSGAKEGVAGEVFRLAGVEIWARKSGEEGMVLNELRFTVIFSDGREKIEQGRSFPDGAEPQEISSFFDEMKVAALDGFISTKAD